MPKIRGIKPEFWTDEDIVDLSIEGRLLFIGLWNLACDNGHVTDKPKQIKMRILPADDVDVDVLLDELAKNGRLERVQGTITILNFAKHQKPHRKWWTCCDLEGCKVPEDAPKQGYNRGGPPSETTSQPLDNGGATVDHGGTTADVDCDGDGDGELKRGTKRAAQLPIGFQPNDANRKVATEHGVDLDRVLPQFCDFHRAKGSTMKDWHLALNTWIRREKPAGPARAPRRLPTEHELPPDGLSPQQYAEWELAQRQKRAQA